MIDRSGTELRAALDVLDFRCDDCHRRALPGAKQCIDCKYGPLPAGGESDAEA